MKFKTKYETQWASPEKLYIVKTSEWRYQKPVTTTVNGSHCGICYLFCPTGCIKDEGSYFAPNLEYCKGCGICARLCPADAIEMIREA